MFVPQRNRTLGFASCALASSLWGCGFFFGKIALAEMGVGAMVLYRFLFATLVLLPLLFTHRPSFDRREWGTLLFCAFLGVPLQFLIQFSGLALTTVSHASLMVGTMPVLLAVAAVLLVTGASGFCPLYVPFHLSTRRHGTARTWGHGQRTSQ